MSQKRRIWPIVTLGILAAVAFVPYQRAIWDGGFSSEEFRLRFMDTTGRPVQGVTLQVLTKAGGVCHLYPINEFLPDSSPVSDSDGRMVFHHASVHPCEFSGKVRENMLGMWFGTTDSPQYVCVFRLGEREVHRMTYRELRRPSKGSTPQEVKILWKHSEWPVKEYQAHHNDWNNRVKQLFDGNGDGKLDREEAVAAGYFYWIPDAAIFEKEKQIDFEVIEQTITLPLP